MRVVSINDFDEALMDELKALKSQVRAVLDFEAEEIAKESVKKLKSTSPKRTGKYANSWSYKDTSDRLKKQYTVYNKKHYRLTHLLEFGHIVVATGGRTKEIPHIKPAEEWARQEFEEKVKEGINEIK